MKKFKDLRDEFKALKSRLEDEHREKMEALYKIYPQFKEEGSASGGSENTRGKLTGLIRQAISRHPNQPFGINEMISWIPEVDQVYAKSITRVDISNTLARLSYQKKLEKVPDSSPTLYKSTGGIKCPRLQKEKI